VDHGGVLSSLCLARPRLTAKVEHVLSIHTSLTAPIRLSSLCYLYVEWTLLL